MMTEHVFYMDTAEGEWYPSIHRLGKPVDADEILQRLNATARLSAERVKEILEDRTITTGDVLALKAYADILEGK
jgi:hypothetical protein